jgi:hypothetical protein
MKKMDTRVEVRRISSRERNGGREGGREGEIPLRQRERAFASVQERAL